MRALLVPVDDNEIFPCCLTHSFHNFHWQSCTIRVTATPLISSFICILDNELIDQISLRAHDLDDNREGSMKKEGNEESIHLNSVIPSELGIDSTSSKISNSFLNSCL
jgi:hypothetical protein